MLETIQNSDIILLRFIHLDLSNPLLDSLCPVLRTKTTWIPLYVCLVYYFWKYFPRDYIKIILISIILVSLADIVCAQLLKPWFHRTRPCQSKELVYWLRIFPYCSHTFSFPSCHAVNHAALVFFIGQFFNKWQRVLLVFWVLLIGFSQLYIGVHYPSDILGGIVLGWVLAICATIICNRWITSNSRDI
jgi:membrane-associated phospholipid phosphatase